jgi:hypothetical protein
MSELSEVEDEEEEVKLLLLKVKWVEEQEA